MQLVIFAAGFGTRLFHYTKHTPKALVSINNYYLIDWVVVRYEKYISSIIINTHYKAVLIREYIKKTPYPIPLIESFEKKILGTGEGLFNAKKNITSSIFWIHNTDIISNYDVQAMLNFHKRHNPMVTLAVSNKKEPSSFLIDKTGRLCGFLKQNIADIIVDNEDKEYQEVSFCGIHCVSEQIFNSLCKEEIHFSIIDCYKELLKKNILILTWNIGSAFCLDVGTIDNFNKACHILPATPYKF